MNAVSLLRDQLQQAHGYLEATLADVTTEQAHWLPPGQANPIGATYAHLVISEDMIINGMLRGSTPLFGSNWAGKTGLSEPMPLPGPAWQDYGPWTRRVKVDLAALREYAQAVYAASDAYLAELPADALSTPLDLSDLGMGKVTLGWVLSRLVVGHVDNECGEISCLKGLQGRRGYPV